MLNLNFSQKDVLDYVTYVIVVHIIEDDDRITYVAVREVDNGL